MDSSVQVLALEWWNWVIIAVCIAVIIVGVTMRKNEA